jgi:transketolase
MADDTPLYARVLCDIGAADPAVFVIDAGLATSMQTGLFRAAFPERYVNLGIAEANAVGYASGLARRGIKPIVHSFGNFLARRAHDQIAISIALPRLPVLLVGGSCGVFDGRNGPSHFAGDDLATFTALPDFRVYEPADAADLKDAMREAVNGDGPAYVRLRRNGMPSAIGDRGSRGATRRVHVAGKPSVVTVVAVGNLLDEALTAVRILADEDIQADLFHVMRIKPIEIEPIFASAKASGRAIVIENHCGIGGGAQAIAGALASHGIKISSFTLPDRFLPAGDPRWLLTHTGLDASSLAERISASLVAEAA